MKKRKQSGLPPAPLLRAVHRHGAEEGLCGNVQRVTAWQLDHPRKGVIIQKITKQFDIRRSHKPGAAKMTAEQVKSYVKNRDSSTGLQDQQYWELWPVDAQGHIDDPEDTFGLCSIIPDTPSTAPNSTFGHFTQVGEAAFYETLLSPQSLGFSFGAVSSAGDMFSTAQDPSARLPAAAPGRIIHKLETRWDSEHDQKQFLVNDGYTEVLENSLVRRS